MSVYRVFIQLALLLFVILICSSFVYAVGPSVRITEILYDADGSDVGKEYVEIINVGPGEIDMATVNFSERSDVSDHFIGQGRGNTVLQPGDVAVIVADPNLFLDNYDFDGVVLDTVQFSLLNVGSTVSLKHDGILLHSVTYSSSRDGAQGNGDSLHIGEDDAILARPPSVGVVRGIAGDETSVAADTDDPLEITAVDGQLHSSSSGDVFLVVEPSMVFPASVTVFSVVRRNSDGEEEVLYGSWNFGDGTYLFGDVVEHSYLHPGAHIIAFQEYIVQSEEADDAANNGVALQQEVVVRFPQVTVDRLNEAFVRLHNHHSFVLDVSGWHIVSSEGSSFVFPDNSLVSSQGQITIPFLLNSDHDIYFVTAGGGQFSGENVLVVGAESEQEKDSVDTDTSSEDLNIEEVEDVVEEGGNTPLRSSDVDDGSPDVRIIGSQNVLSSGTSTLVFDTTDTDSGHDMTTGGASKTRMVVIWVLLLIVIILIALAPLFFARNDQKKHGDV